MQALQGISLQEQEHHTVTHWPAKSEGYFTPWILDISLHSIKKPKARKRKINEKGKVTQCKDFPDIENLHHHCWEFWKERGQDGGGGTRNRGREGKRGRGCGIRDRRGGMCPGTGFREMAVDGKKEGKKRRERKLRQDSCLPGYPHLFIDLGMTECNWVAAWQQKSWLGGCT